MEDHVVAFLECLSLFFFFLTQTWFGKPSKSPYWVQKPKALLHIHSSQSSVLSRNRSARPKQGLLSYQNAYFLCFTNFVNFLDLLAFLFAFGFVFYIYTDLLLFFFFGYVKVLIAAGASAAIGQLSKPFTSVLLYGRDFDLKAVIRAGGFPSTHSSVSHFLHL